GTILAADPAATEGTSAALAIAGTPVGDSSAAREVLRQDGSVNGTDRGVVVPLRLVEFEPVSSPGAAAETSPGVLQVPAEPVQQGEQASRPLRGPVKVAAAPSGVVDTADVARQRGRSPAWVRENAL